MSSHATEVTFAAIDKSNPALEIPAVARCCKDWKKVYRAVMDEDDYEPRATENAGAAYRAALPPLTSRENCRDFIACIAHGMLIGAISEKNGGKLLYAAQIALSAFAADAKLQKSAS